MSKEYTLKCKLCKHEFVSDFDFFTLCPDCYFHATPAEINQEYGDNYYFMSKGLAPHLNYRPLDELTVAYYERVHRDNT